MRLMGSQFGCSAMKLQSFIKLIQLLQEIAEVGNRLDMLGLESDGLAIAIDSFVVTLESGQCQAHVVMCGRVAGIAAQGLAIARQCRLDLAGLAVRFSQIAPERRMFGRDFRCNLKVSGRCVRLPRLESHNPEQVLCVRIARIRRQNRAEAAFGVRQSVVL